MLILSTVNENASKRQLTQMMTSQDCITLHDYRVFVYTFLLKSI